MSVTECTNGCMSYMTNAGMAPQQAQPRCGACCHQRNCSGVGDFRPPDSTPADSTPADSTPADSTPADSTPADSTPADSTPTDSSPADSTTTPATPGTTPSGTTSPPQSDGDSESEPTGSTSLIDGYDDSTVIVCVGMGIGLIVLIVLVK